jgi:hypothetical protein
MLVVEGLEDDIACLMGVYELMVEKVVIRRAVWQKQGGGQGQKRFLYYSSSNSTTDIDAKATPRERRTKRRGAKKTTDPKEGPMWFQCGERGQKQAHALRSEHAGGFI